MDRLRTVGGYGSRSATKDRFSGKSTGTFGRWPTLVLRVVCLAALTEPLPARAVDGCQVLLCLAASNWRRIPMCVPTIEQLHRDLARARPFPTCDMAGPGNNALHQWASAPGFCPPQYVREVDGPNGPVPRCSYAGAVSVSINGLPFTRTWWTPDGDSVTEFSDAAKLQLGSWDARFDNDYAAWLAAQLPPPCWVC